MSRYLQISDYGLIGNQASMALVSRLGSIDWCCFPYPDSPSHFAAILDQQQGGKFQIAPQGDFRSEQRYLQRSHVLETLFETPHGRAILVDWMPMGDDESDQPLIYRRIDTIQGKIQWQLQCSPRFIYGRETARAEWHRQGILFRGESQDLIGLLLSSVPLEISRTETSAQARFTLETGQEATFSWGWGRRSRPPKSPSPRITADYWRNWAHHCDPAGCAFAGPWHDAVTRSALTVKLLMSSSFGSIAEAATTSIAGQAGGSRTWDFRCAWIRNGALAIQALSNLGYREECDLFFGWICDTMKRDGAAGLQPVYRLDGGKLLDEIELHHLSGYQESRPVRIGNLSASQFQLDIYGQVILAAAEYYKVFRALPESIWPALAEIADYVCQAWKRPDHGMWEVRCKPKHFVASKAFCWAALDRAMWLAKETGHIAQPRWALEKENLHRTICEQGYDPSQESFVRAFGERELDSATLYIPILGLLPFDDPRVMTTLNALQTQLCDGVFMKKYQGDDGVDGSDGLHLVSSLLHVSFLALGGQADEASDRLAELCSYSTPLGLFGEQIDLRLSETTGNFPSASVHLSLINAALCVGMSRGIQAPSLRFFTSSISTMHKTPVVR